MKLVSLCLLLLIPVISLAESSIRGHNRLIYSRFESQESQFLLNSRVTGLLKEEQRWGFEVAYEVFGSFEQVYAPSEFQYRVDDLNLQLSERWLQNLDRFYGSIYGEGVDFYVGRQVVSFGSARSVNPIDVLVPFDFVMVNMEQRNGVDAVRTRVALGELSEIDAGYVLGQGGKYENSLAFLSVKANVEGWDTALTFMKFKEHDLWGVDTQGSIGGFGTWLESAYVNLKPEIGGGYLRLSAGGEYVFEFDLMLFAEFHFNGAEGNLTALQEGGVFLSRRNYLILGGGYPITPLVSVSASLMSNLDDHSSLISPKLEWNFKEDFYFDLGGFVGIGSEGEFNNYQATVFTLLRHYY